MVEGVGDIRYHHFHRNYTWVGKCPVGSGRLYVGTKAAKRPVSHGKKTAFADVASAVFILVSRSAIARVCASFSFLLLVLSHCSSFLSWVISSFVSVVSPLNADTSWFFFLAQVSSLVSSWFLQAASACTI